MFPTPSFHRPFNPHFHSFFPVKTSNMTQKWLKSATMSHSQTTEPCRIPIIWWIESWATSRDWRLSRKKSRSRLRRARGLFRSRRQSSEASRTLCRIHSGRAVGVRGRARWCLMRIRLPVNPCRVRKLCRVISIGRWVTPRTPPIMSQSNKPRSASNLWFPSSTSQAAPTPTPCSRTHLLTWHLRRTSRTSTTISTGKQQKTAKRANTTAVA